METFTPKKTYEITGESKQRLQYWNLKGLITPADAGSGIGVARKYSYSNLIEILLIQHLFRRLRNIDIVKEVIEKITEKNPYFFKTSLEDPNFGENNLVLWIDNNDTITAHLVTGQRADELHSEGRKHGYDVFSKRLDFLRTELSRRIGALKKD